MRNFLSILICVALAGFGVARAVTPAKQLAAKAKTMQKKPSGKKANAKTLLTDAKKALAAMLKNARADKALDPKKPKNKPFYAAAKKIAKQLDRAEKGLASKSNDFFDAI